MINLHAGVCFGGYRYVNNIEIFNGKFNFLFKCDLTRDLDEGYIIILF